MDARERALTAASSLDLDDDGEALVVGAIVLALSRGVNPTVVVVRNQARHYQQTWGDQAPALPTFEAFVVIIERFRSAYTKESQ